MLCTVSCLDCFHKKEIQIRYVPALKKVIDATKDKLQEVQDRIVKAKDEQATALKKVKALGVTAVSTESSEEHIEQAMDEPLQKKEEVEIKLDTYQNSGTIAEPEKEQQLKKQISQTAEKLEGLGELKVATKEIAVQQGHEVQGEDLIKAFEDPISANNALKKSAFAEKLKKASDLVLNIKGWYEAKPSSALIHQPLRSTSDWTHPKTKKQLMIAVHYMPKGIVDALETIIESGNTIKAKIRSSYTSNGVLGEVAKDSPNYLGTIGPQLLTEIALCVELFQEIKASDRALQRIQAAQKKAEEATRQGELKKFFNLYLEALRSMFDALQAFGEDWRKDD